MDFAFSGRCLAGGALVASAALAAPDVDYAVEYSAPEHCPDAAAFVRAILARLPRARAVPTEAARVRFRVQFVDEPDGLVGNLWVFVDGQGTAVRRVPGVACEDAVSSMAVIAALVLEGRAGATECAAPVEAEPESKVEVPVRPEPASSIPAPLRPPAAERQALPVELRIAAAGVLASAVAPDPAWGLEGGVEGRFGEPNVGGARLSVLWVPPHTVRRVEGDAQFSLIAARLSACLSVFEAPPFRAHACLGADLGQLEGRADPALNGRPQSMVWFAGGPTVRPELALVPWLSLEAQADFRVLGPNDRFVFEPDDLTVHDVPRFGWGAALGLSARPY